MTEEIPPNFDKPWFDSDIILLTENADGKKLYANKTVLSIFSPVMRAMFTRGFKEANQESVEIHVDYKAMKEILRILFNFNRPTITRRQEAYDCDLLMKMFKSADFLDFGFIRQLCLDQMLSKPTVDIAVAALDLDLHDVLMNILGAMGRGSLQDFLAISNSQLCFSKSDLAVVFKKIYSRKWTENEEKPSEALNLEEVAPEIENPRIDLTKKWFASDVAFMTKNSAERVLYANKGTIAAFSKHFRDLFFDVKMFSKQFAAFVMDEESCDFPILLLDYEYATVKTILTIILQCNDDYTATVPLYNPALLYDMFRVASKDHLDIPNIQKMCIANLLRQPSIESLDVAIRLKLDIKTTLLEKMSGADLLDWLCYSEGMLVYRDGDKDVEISTRRSDILLSLNDLRIVSGKLDSVTMHQLNVSYSDDGWDAPPIRYPYGHRATTSKWNHFFGNDDEEEW